MTIQSKATQQPETWPVAITPHALPDNFRQALAVTYLEDPCGVLPHALWRTLALLEDHDCHFAIENGSVSHLRIQKKNRLLLYWHRPTSFSALTEEQVEKIDHAVLHQRQIDNFATGKFDHTPYYRLIHRHSTPLQNVQPTGFALKTINPKDEAGLIHEFVTHRFIENQVSAETMLSWASHPVFDPELWLLLVEKKNDIPIGLGIAECDPAVREGVVMWVQILSEYRGHGLGKWLCSELLNRLSKRADFSTVCGQLHNDTRPDILYRKAGFSGHDVWWVLRRKEEA